MGASPHGPRPIADRAVRRADLDPRATDDFDALKRCPAASLAFDHPWAWRRWHPAGRSDGLVESAVVHGSIQSAVGGYYDDVLSTHGPTHRGVDWSSRASQEQRFATLLEGIDWSDDPTLLDFGCGCGALAAYLDRLGVSCRYVGYDIAPAMIDAAGAAFGGHQDRCFCSDLCALEPADHVIASGIFNVKLDTPRAQWMRYVGETIAMLGSLARRRLAFNMLHSASASGLRRDDLFYADPCAVARSCAASIGGTISLREDYDLWEFTVVVSFDDG